MLSELFLFAILCNCECKSNEVSVPKNNNTGQLIRLQRESGLVSAFTKAYYDIKNFYSKIIGEKTMRVKNAFSVFFEEINKKPLKPGPLPNNGCVGPKLKGDLAKSFRNQILKEDTVEQLILKHGYRSETHTVLTGDGYMLTINRINGNLDKINPRVVILHHGLFGSAEDWLFLGSGKALPYLLLDNYFDVWLLNARGNRYSKIHVTTKKERIEFWDFSWHEMGVYDLPAAIKFVQEITQVTSVDYIGHSMGATALLVLLSTLPEYNLMIKTAILLAPLAFMYHSEGPIRLLAEFSQINGNYSLNFLGRGQFARDHKIPQQLADKFCKGDKVICMNPLLLIASGGKEDLNNDILREVLRRTPSGGSAKTLMHYVQVARSGFFQMYDYGVLNNIRKYGYSDPPFYNLSRVSVPVSIFSSLSDWLATQTDIQTLIPLLSQVAAHHIVNTDNFGHLDFVWSQNAPSQVFDIIINSILGPGETKTITVTDIDGETNQIKITDGEKKEIKIITELKDYEEDMLPSQ